MLIMGKREKGILLTTILSLSLVGCGSTGASSDSNVTLTYWSMWNSGEPQQAVLQKNIEKFEKKYPNIHVQVQWGGRKILSKVQQALISNDPPDLIDKDSPEIAGSLIKSDQTIPLDDLLDKTIIDESDSISKAVPKEILHFYDKNGHTSIIPEGLLTSGIWYNKSLFAKYGITPPQTWSDFLNVCAKLKANGISPIAADGTIDFYNAYWFYWLTDRIMGPGQFLHASGDKTGKSWENPGFLEAAKKIQTLINDNYLMPGYQGSKWPSGQVAWAQGKAAMLLMGSWAPSETAKYATTGFDYGMMPFPVINPKVSNASDVEVYTMGWAIPKGSKHVDAAEKFILFSMSKDNLQGFATTAHYMTPRLDIPAPTELKDSQDLFKNMTKYHNYDDGVQNEYPDYWQSVFVPLDNKLFFGQISPEDFISQLETQSQKYWSDK